MKLKTLPDTSGYHQQNVKKHNSEATTVLPKNILASDYGLKMNYMDFIKLNVKKNENC